MNRKTFESEALYRFKIIAPLVNEVFPRGELKRKLLELSVKWYDHPERGWEQFAFKTIEEWFYLYKRSGLAGLERKRRSDRHQSRSISPEIGEMILDMKKENPRRTVRQILKELSMAGIIRPDETSSSSVHRFLAVHRYDLARHQRDRIQKRRFAFAFSNECWQSDVCHGPYLRIEGYPKKKKVFLFGFLDDASRVIPHVGIVFAENLENFLGCLKEAIQKKGIPERLYLDNASYYRSPLVKTIGARLGIKVMYCTPYSPYKKGKIERWWRTCREQFLSHIDRERVYTLEQLNRLLTIWIEQDYHHTVHSSLKTTPIDAWQSKARRIRYPEPVMLQRDFLAEETRVVRKDGTITLNGVYYEVDSMLEGESVTVRFDPHRTGTVYIYHRGEFYQESQPVDETENRKSRRLKAGDVPRPRKTGINFLDLLEQAGERDV